MVSVYVYILHVCVVLRTLTIMVKVVHEFRWILNRDIYHVVEVVPRGGLTDGNTHYSTQTHTTQLQVTKTTITQHKLTSDYDNEQVST